MPPPSRKTTKAVFIKSFFKIIYIKELLKQTPTHKELGKLKDYEFIKNKVTKNYTKLNFLVA